MITATWRDSIRAKTLRWLPDARRAGAASSACLLNDLPLATDDLQQHARFRRVAEMVGGGVVEYTLRDRRAAHRLERVLQRNAKFLGARLALLHRQRHCL